MPKPTDFTPEENAKRDRCVKALQEKGGVKNPYAVCTAAVRRGKGKEKSEHA